MANPDLRLSFGAMFVGCVISIFLSGLGSLQTYQYFRHYRKKDSWLISSMVFAVWILDFTHTIFITQAMWFYLVLNWGNLEDLDLLIWSVAASVSVTGFVTFAVQMFFAYRVWCFSKRNTFLGGLITLMTIVRLGSALATTVKMIQLGRFSTFLAHFRWLFTFGLAMSCGIDLMLTSALCYFLRVNRTGHSTMDEVVHKLLMYTISNGILTTLGAFLAMVFAVAMPDTFLFIALHFVILKCYVNSLLSTLNSRDALKKRNDSGAVAYQISIEGHTQPHFRRYNPDHYAEPSSNDHPIPLSHVFDFSGAESPSVGDVKVHVQSKKFIPVT